MTLHLSECPEKAVKCPVAGCTAIVRRKNSKEHVVTAAASHAVLQAGEIQRLRGIIHFKVWKASFSLAPFNVVRSYSLNHKSGIEMAFTTYDLQMQKRNDKCHSSHLLHLFTGKKAPIRAAWSVRLLLSLEAGSRLAEYQENSGKHRLPVPKWR